MVTEYVGVPPQFDVPPKRFYGAWIFYVNMTSFAATANVLTTFKPGFAGRLYKTYFVAHTPQVAGGAIVDISFLISGRAVNGGTIALITTGADLLGELTTGTALRSGNGFDTDDTITALATVTAAFNALVGSLWILYEGKTTV